MQNGEIQEKKKGGWIKYVAIGCAGVLVLAAVGGYFAYRGIKSFVADMAEQYTDTVPVQLPVVEVSNEEADAVIKRLNDFTEALKTDQPASELVLTSNDINTLIQKHPDWKHLAGKVYVTVDGDKIKGEASIPLGEITGMFKGRYLNGSAVFRLDMSAGRLLIFLDSLIVREKPVPEEFMKQLRVKNLAENTNKDPKYASTFEKLDSITVRDGAIYIVPKKAQGGTQTNTETEGPENMGAEKPGDAVTQ